MTLLPPVPEKLVWLDPEALDPPLSLIRQLIRSQRLQGRGTALAVLWDCCQKDHIPVRELVLQQRSLRQSTIHSTQRCLHTAAGGDVNDTCNTFFRRVDGGVLMVAEHTHTEPANLPLP